MLGDLLVLIERTELGARAAAGGRERWAISCARRAVSHNVEWLGPELPALREALTRAARFVRERPDDDVYQDAIAPVEQGWRTTGERYQQVRGARGANVSRRSIFSYQAQRSVEAVRLCLDHAAARGETHERVAEVARSAFVLPEQEAEHQARRLLLCTKLLPSGADLLVRLDHVEALGRFPTDPDERAWIEAQRVALMADDETSRMAVLLRHLELVFLPELERIS